MLAQQQAMQPGWWPRKDLMLLTLQRTVHWPVPKLPAVAAGQ